MEITVKEIDANQTLLKFLKKCLKNLPLSRIHSLLRKKDVKVNGVRVKDEKLILKEGDTVFVFGVGKIERPKNNFRRYEPRFEVVHEDDQKIIVYKPSNLVVHAADKVDNLDNQVLTYLEKTGQWNPDDGAIFKPTHCHRLDKPTCGLIVYAKTKKYASWFAENINNKDLIKKFYLLSINGKSDKKFAVEGWIQENKEKERQEIVDEQVPGSKHVLTQFKLLAFDGQDSLIEAELFSGRKHQIRASMHKLKKPIIGDKKYGSKIPTKLQLESYKIVISGKTYMKTNLFTLR